MNTVSRSSLTRREVFLRLMRMLEQLGMRYCILGNTSGFPDSITSDVDVMMEIESQDELYVLLEKFCRKESLYLIQMVQHERCAWACSLAWLNCAGRYCSLQVDCCNDFVRGGRHYLSHQLLLGRCVKARDGLGLEQGFYVPCPSDQFIYYLLKRVDKSSLAPSHGHYLSDRWREDCVGAKRRLSRFWPVETAHKLAAAAEADSWNGIIADLPRVRSSLHRRNRRTIFDRTERWMRVIGRVVQPPGLAVCIQGGSPKLRSEVASAIHAWFGPSFFRHVSTSLRTDFQITDDGGSVEARSRSSNRFRISETLAWFGQGCSLRWGRLRIKLVRAGLILFQGFVPEGNGLNPNGHGTGVAFLQRFSSRIVPKPEVCIFLQEDLDEAVGSRVSTCSSDSPGSQRFLAGCFQSLHVCEASSSPEELETQLCGFLIKHLSSRLVQRHGQRTSVWDTELRGAPSIVKCSIPRTESRFVLGMRVDATCYEDLTSQTLQWAVRGDSRYVCEAPVHMVMEAYDNAEYRCVINKADVVTPGGMPLVWILRRMGFKRQPRVYGPEIMVRVCSAAAEKGIPVGFYGASDETVRRLSDALKSRNPSLKVAFIHAPPFRELTVSEDAGIIDQINASGCRILFVGLGCPKQELWMARHRGSVQAVMFGVGAAFDFISGVKKQAPSVMQRLGLEWVFRLATEPRRLWFRYLYHNPRFVALVLLQLLGIRMTPLKKL